MECDCFTFDFIFVVLITLFIGLLTFAGAQLLATLRKITVVVTSGDVVTLRQPAPPRTPRPTPPESPRNRSSNSSSGDPDAAPYHNQAARARGEVPPPPPFPPPDDGDGLQTEPPPPPPVVQGTVIETPARTPIQSQLRVIPSLPARVFVSRYGERYHTQRCEHIADRDGVRTLTVCRTCYPNMAVVDPGDGP